MIWGNMRMAASTLRALEAYRHNLQRSVECDPGRYPSWLAEQPRLSLGQAVQYMLEKQAGHAIRRNQHRQRKRRQQALNAPQG